MSILAAPRNKQRISVDPQNVGWSTDDNKFGKKLMEKMGWNDGDGLGRNRHGMTNNLKLKANVSGKGLGATANDYDSTWIAHHDDFADLLTALNKNKPAEEESEETAAAKNKQISLELSSRSLKRRIHYQKFTRAKDITGYDEQAKKAVLGLGRVKVKKEEQKVIIKPEIEDISEEAAAAMGSVTNTQTVSTVSVGDYFKDKMAAKLAALKAGASFVKTEIKEEVEEYTNYGVNGVEMVKVETTETEETFVQESGEKKKKKKRKHDREETADVDGVPEVKRVREEEVAVEEEEVSIKKKKKKSKKRDEEQEETQAEEVVEETAVVEEKEKSKKKKRKEREAEAEEEQQEAESVQTDETAEKKKKKKKSKKRDNEDEE